MSQHASGHELSWHTSYYPLLVSVGVLFLVPLAFIFNFVYHNTAMTFVSLGIGAPLTLMSIIGWVKEGLEDEHGYSEGLSVWAMPLFILAEAMLFVGFFIAYWVMRLKAPSWPPAGTPHMAFTVPILMTILLVSSSVTIHFAEHAIDHDNKSGFITWLIATMILGVLFLCMSGLEWKELIGEGFIPHTNAYSSAFYAITGFHGSHVLVGLLMFIAILVPALSGTVSKAFVKSASMYWHFVDIVWFFVVSQIYFW